MAQVSGSTFDIHLPSINANPLPDDNWTWSVESKKQWEIESVGNEHWRDSLTSSKPLNKFPYVLGLGVDELDSPLLSFHGRDTSGGRVLVTESYNNIFNRLLHIRQHDSGKRRGVVLIGQPGTGEFL